MLVPFSHIFLHFPSFDFVVLCECFSNIKFANEHVDLIHVITIFTHFPHFPAFSAPLSRSMLLENIINIIIIIIERTELHSRLCFASC
jgi:hypothetical protein